MLIHRTIQAYIKKYLYNQTDKKYAIIVYGPRQVGKTTLLEHLISLQPPRALEFQDKTPHQFQNGSAFTLKAREAAYFNADHLDVRVQFAYENITQLESTLKGLKLLLLDEAQRIENIGLVLKILVDHHPDLQIIATGSSSFELSNKINEPLTGRKRVFHLYPFSFEELYGKLNFIEQQRKLPSLLRFGSYPDIIEKNENEAIARLRELTDSYLFKDVFSFQRLKKHELLTKLLQLLAFQVGSEVTFHELAQQLGVDQLTVQNYIQLLEEAFVIFRLGAFKRNLRNEITKSRKIYFWDLGIRNTLINNFNPLDLRDDVRKLWENFCIIERLKHLQNHQKFVNCYFWRTYQNKEIDYIEEANGELHTYEFTWSSKKKKKLPKDLLEQYKPK